MAEDDLELRDVAGPCINILEAAIGPTKHGQVGPRYHLYTTKQTKLLAKRPRGSCCKG